LLFINLFYLQHFVFYRLQLLDVSQAQWSFLWRRTCKVKTAKKRCNSSLTTALNTLWYVHSTIFFCKLLFTWIKFDDFSFFYFQETYNSRLRERYGNDPSTHLDFNPNLWMEAGSSGGPNRNQVYKLSNTTTNL
jgi:3-deoxy-D-manno-octulosonic-acid transferase